MAIQQHPIPQNVTAYQFRLVGDMTLKQFLQIGGGIAVGLFFYATKLPFFFKWPLIGLSVGLGAGMAFLPVEGRPLDQWLLAFIKSIYTPTIYTWKPDYEETKATPVHPQPTLKPVPPQPVNQNQTPLPGNLNTTTHPLTEKMGGQTTTTTHNIAIPKPHITLPVAPPTPAVAAPQTPKPVTPNPVTDHSIQLPNLTPKPTGSSSQPVFSQNLPIPNTPQTPNTIVGMTLTPDGHILDGSIVEIRSQGATVRATKSNKLGQFLFAQPLNDGNYQITAEKDGFKFPTFALSLTSQVVQPLKLQAIATTTNTAAKVNIYSANQTAVYA